MGSLRIIAGTLRGRRIEIPSGSRIRPTADRVREALFSILGPAVDGASVLDAYCGSGALGFEALSRGARQVVFVDADRDTVGRLRANADRLGVAAACRCEQGRVLERLRGGSLAGPYDLILADPPYESGEGALFLPLAAGRLAPEGQVVVERARRLPAPDPPDLDRFRTATYGSSSLDFFRGAGSG